MNEQTTTESPEISLSNGLAMAFGNNGQSDSGSKSTENTPLNEDHADRGTQETGSQNNQTVPEAKQNQANGNKAEATSEASHKTVEPQNNQKPNRGEQRKQEIQNDIRSLIATRNKIESEIAEARKAREEGSKSTEAVSATKALIPPPEKPKYSREQLENALDKYEDAGDHEMARAIRSELRNVDKYEKDLILWEARNGRAIEQHQSALNYYRQEIADKYPEVLQSDSPQAQVFQRVLKQVPEVLNRADGELIAAQVSDWFVRASREEATAKENQELKEKLTALEKKIQPASQKSSPKIGNENGKVNLDAEFSQKLKEVYRARG